MHQKHTKGRGIPLPVKNYLSRSFIFRKSPRDRFEVLVRDVRLHSDLFRIIGVY